MPNFAALRAAVFPLSTKNLRGAADIRPPSVRGLKMNWLILHCKQMTMMHMKYAMVVDDKKVY